MSDSCSTCRHRFDLQKWDYSDVRNKGVPKEKMLGYVCDIFACEGIMVNMIGCDSGKEICECYEARRKCENCLYSSHFKNGLIFCIRKKDSEIVEPDYCCKYWKEEK